MSPESPETPGRVTGRGARGYAHVMPRSRGGQATWENIVCACVKCNVRKGGRTPWEAGMKLTQEPVKPKTSPALRLKLSSGKYQSWRTFLDHAYWSVELR